jgi:riboflavin synthase
MFTGIIEAVGQVLALDYIQQHMRLVLSNPFMDIQKGESIAVNGVCLTSISELKQDMIFDISSETLSKTFLGDLKVGDEVNLERALKTESRMGGHYVSGHVDTIAQVIGFEHEEKYVKLSIGGFTSEQMLYLIPKGSITLNGVSLTINHIQANHIELMLVPHTLECSALKYLKPGQHVNIEFDYMARVIAHQLQYFLQHNFNINSMKK